MCGKDFFKENAESLNAGSPPRVREGHENADYEGVISRITPACAGRTKVYSLIQLFKEDHPRVCGKD